MKNNENPVCILLYGAPGSGKSTLAMTSRKPIMLDCDSRGADRIPQQYRIGKVINCSTIKDYDSFVSKLKNGGFAKHDTIVIDGVAKLLGSILTQKVISESKNRAAETLNQAGWGVLGAKFKNFVQVIKESGKNIVFIAHEKKETINERVYYTPDIPGGSSQFLMSEAFLIGRIVKSSSSLRHLTFKSSEEAIAKENHVIESFDIPNWKDSIDTTEIIETALQENVFDKLEESFNVEKELAKRYILQQEELYNILAKIETQEDVDNAIATFSNMQWILDNRLVAEEELEEKKQQIRKKEEEKLCLVQQVDCDNILAKIETQEDVDNAIATFSNMQWILDNRNLVAKKFKEIVDSKGLSMQKKEIKDSENSDSKANN